MRRTSLPEWHSIPLRFIDAATLIDDEFEEAGPRMALRRSVVSLHSFAFAMQTIGTTALLPSSLHRIVGVMGHRRPYLFERNLSRWPDGRHYLVDRGYAPFTGIACDIPTLERLGAVAWNDSPHCQLAFTESCVVIADDLLMSQPSCDGLRALAGIVQAIAEHFDAVLRRPLKPSSTGVEKNE